MTGSGENSIGAMKPNQFKVTQDGKYKDVYYAVPVTVTIDLEKSMGFHATETVVVVLHIDFSQYGTSNTPEQSAQSGNDLIDNEAPEVEVNVNAVANPVAEGSDVENSVEDPAE